MPMLFRYRGYAFCIYFNDYVLSHVHIVRADGEAILDLASMRVVRSHGIPWATLRILAVKALDERAWLLEEWERIHGPTQ
jgi:hypothetical protein